jgi:hypothetical protein
LHPTLHQYLKLLRGLGKNGLKGRSSKVANSCGVVRINMRELEAKAKKLLSPLHEYPSLRCYKISRNTRVYRRRTSLRLNISNRVFFHEAVFRNGKFTDCCLLLVAQQQTKVIIIIYKILLIL